MTILPIGTIVTLKNATKRILVIGYYPQEVGSDTVYDYSGVPFPEGLVDSKKILLFNHKQINEINHFSINDEETKKFFEEIEKVKERENGNL